MKFIKWINLVFNPQEKIELSVQEKEILSELQNENKAFLFSNK